MKDEIYNKLNNELCNVTTDKETISHILDATPPADSYEDTFQELKPLDLFDDTKTGEPAITEQVCVKFSFGKNGKGITDELTRIGKRIEDLATANYVYLVNANIDSLDDVYDLTFEIHERD